MLSTKCTSLGEDASVYVTVAVAYLSNILNVRRHYRVISLINSASTVRLGPLQTHKAGERKGVCVCISVVEFVSVIES